MTTPLIVHVTTACPYLKCQNNGTQTTVNVYDDRIEHRCECGWFNLYKVSDD